ncbi:MAG: hypothetical protein LUO93_11340 [Methanomicrobiales archaeon]|nr:hypothetical protein [Methanomicrobiales archaeon]
MIHSHHDRFSERSQTWNGRFLFLVLGAILSILFVCQPVFAHPPSALSFSYNQTDQELTVTITHGVRDKSTHYIREVTIRKNGVPLFNQTYTSQPTATVFSYSYPLSTQDGDRVEVTATCNLYGSLSDTYVPSSGLTTTGQVTGPPTLWPYHMSLLSIGFVCMILGVIFARSRNVRTGWFKMHSSLEKVGFALIVAGIVLGAYMVAVSGGPHFRVTHGIIGATGAGLAGVGFSLGIGRNYIHKRKVLARAVHTRTGYVTIAVMTGAIATGILLLVLV